MPQSYADLAVPLALDRLFTYSVPGELAPAARPGVRALIPFGNRSVTGIIVRLHTIRPGLAAIKPVQDILDAEPLLSEELLKLSAWIAEYYAASWGEVLRAAVVQQGFRPPERTVRPASGGGSPERPLTEGQASILELVRASGALTMKQLRSRSGIRHVYSAVNALERQGLLSVEEEQPSPPSPKYERTIDAGGDQRARWQAWLGSDEGAGRPRELQRRALSSLLALPGEPVGVASFLKNSGVPMSALRSLERKGLIAFGKREVIRTGSYELYEAALGKQHVTLNRRQAEAVEAVGGVLSTGTFRTFLLHGVTGSGKTQVYIESIRKARETGKSALVLVPEISLTPQIVRRFKLHFGEEVAVWHSRLSAGERHDAWRLAQAGKASIVIGARSAVFAPLRRLGLIIVDEEHESSYKQFDRAPRYHARDVAIMRGHLAGAAVVLGSATPSLESYANALSGKYTLLELPERADNAQLPRIELVDMAAERQRTREELRERRRSAAGSARAALPFEPGMISRTLGEHIARRLEKHEGTILLQNRRGFAPLLECPDCGHAELCDNCHITLTYHLTQRHLRCHYCGAVKQPPTACPQCGSAHIRLRGFGTQRVEEELRRLFPAARLLRMDLDTTTRRGSHDRILKKFSEGEADILLGTQMVGKGLDISRVTLVGVISADTQMLLPDFRSAERTFQLLTQVAGRAGRSALAGEVIIQTFQPGHYCLGHVLRHDFRSFYEEELGYRKELAYPPYSRLALIECRGASEEAVRRHIGMLGESIKKRARELTVLGPSPAAIPKLRKQFRWHLVLKDAKSSDPSGTRLRRTIGEVLEAHSSSRPGKSGEVFCLVDIDPVGMM